jgi:hypothetical protein
MNKGEILTSKTELTAPPIVELAQFDGDEQHGGGGDYIVVSRDGDWFILAPAGHPEPDDSFFASPPAKPFRAPSSKVRLVRKVSWYGDSMWPWGNPWGGSTIWQEWRRRVVLLWGQEAFDREWARIGTLGTTHDERQAAWFAERQALLEAGLISA